MYDYISGELTELTPTEVVIDCNGIGYKVMISLQTYSALKQVGKIKLFIHHHLREDIEQLYGFYDKEERNIFRLLIEVSGVGPNSARMMLSSLTTDDVRTAIVTGDINKLKSVKGIGLKTAQRLLIDLKDKIVKSAPSGGTFPVFSSGNQYREEAVSALILLGFSRTNVEKVIDGAIHENPSYDLEQLIKFSLKKL